MGFSFGKKSNGYFDALADCHKSHSFGQRGFADAEKAPRQASTICNVKDHFHGVLLVRIVVPRKSGRGSASWLRVDPA